MIRLNNEVNRDAIVWGGLDRPDDGDERPSSSHKARGALPDVTANDIENQINLTNVLQPVIGKVHELVRAKLK